MDCQEARLKRPPSGCEGRASNRNGTWSNSRVKATWNSA
ncbi:Hypothetical protein AA314_01463 [Archangium gephyra]|uniref:Uncharacterized protein n=1 Tax=Archangium gephyra TaxID=48 RepID=A0AAC8TBD3_9BACT|nr:Hypothetical protein AA314_01463 [Archangium gephyra]